MVCGRIGTRRFGIPIKISPVVLGNAGFFSCFFFLVVSWALFCGDLPLDLVGQETKTIDLEK